MAEDDGLSFAPVFVIDVDVSSVFFSNSYVWHCVFPFWLRFLLGESLTQTTSDNQRFAGDPFGIVGSEEYRSRRDIVRLTDSTERSHRFKRRSHVAS